MKWIYSNFGLLLESLHLFRRYTRSLPCFSELKCWLWQPLLKCFVLLSNDKSSFQRDDESHRFLRWQYFCMLSYMTLEWGWGYLLLLFEGGEESVVVALGTMLGMVLSIYFWLVMIVSTMCDIFFVFFTLTRSPSFVCVQNLIVVLQQSWSGCFAVFQN